MDDKRAKGPQSSGLTVPRSRPSVSASGGGDGTGTKLMGGHGDKQREYAELMRVALAREVRTQFSSLSALHHAHCITRSTFWVQKLLRVMFFGTDRESCMTSPHCFCGL